MKKELNSRNVSKKISRRISRKNYRRSSATKKKNRRSSATKKKNRRSSATKKKNRRSLVTKKKNRRSSATKKKNRRSYRKKKLKGGALAGANTYDTYGLAQLPPNRMVKGAEKVMPIYSTERECMTNLGPEHVGYYEAGGQFVRLGHGGRDWGVGKPNETVTKVIAAIPARTGLLEVRAMLEEAMGRPWFQSQIESVLVKNWPALVEGGYDSLSTLWFVGTADLEKAGFSPNEQTDLLDVLQSPAFAKQRRDVAAAFMVQPKGEEHAALESSLGTEETGKSSDGLDRELSQLLEIFGMFDANGDGKLSKDEYKVYLRGIGLWGSEKGSTWGQDNWQYVEEDWDEDWPEECERMESGTDGIGWEAFETILYGKNRQGKAPADLESCKSFFEAHAPAVQELFGIFDADGDGKLSKDEYKAYLRGIGAWGTDGYTDKTWDAGWPEECEKMGSTTDGINLEGFDILYKRYRPWHGVEDLLRARLEPQPVFRPRLFPAADKQTGAVASAQPVQPQADPLLDAQPDAQTPTNFEKLLDLTKELAEHKCKKELAEMAAAHSAKLRVLYEQLRSAQAAVAQSYGSAEATAR